MDGKKRNRDLPHSHTGVLQQYTSGPFDMSLGSEDENILAKGISVMKQLSPVDSPDNLGGKAICVQDVDAPKRAVWNQILDMDNYVGKVSKVKECKNYFVGKNGNGSIQIKTKMIIGVMPGYVYENYYNHCFSPTADSVTWSLDYEKSSDFDDVAGHWHVEEHPSKPGCSRVFYACDLKVKNPLPKPIMSFLQKTALKQATAWVKKESEKNPCALIPKKFR